jgi:hypothetical protein
MIQNPGSIVNIEFASHHSQNQGYSSCCCHRRNFRQRWIIHIFNKNIGYCGKLPLLLSLVGNLGKNGCNGRPLGGLVEAAGEFPPFFFFL